MKYFILTVVIVILALLFAFIISIGMDKQGRVNCRKWHEQSKEYVGFYLTESQQKQCDYLGVIT